ncbi:MAG: hypothetical protein M1816_003804 [Peltula sp. TS41687]|nr:MAG: hypothetical protein M1816_003804 [Peltula sp. TS41687]
MGQNRNQRGRHTERIEEAAKLGSPRARDQTHSTVSVQLYKIVVMLKTDVATTTVQFTVCVDGDVENDATPFLISPSSQRTKDLNMSSGQRLTYEELLHQVLEEKQLRRAAEEKSQAALRQPSDLLPTDTDNWFGALHHSDRPPLPNAFVKHTVELPVTNLWGRNKCTLTFEERAEHPLDDLGNRLSEMDIEDADPGTPKPRRIFDKLVYLIMSKGNSARSFYSSTAPREPRITDRSGAKFAEEAVATVITQTFDYLIDQGVSYGYATGGKGFIFLFFHPNDPQTLFYEHVSTAQAVRPDGPLQPRLSAVVLAASFAGLPPPMVDRFDRNGPRRPEASCHAGRSIPRGFLPPVRPFRRSSSRFASRQRIWEERPCLIRTFRRLKPAAKLSSRGVRGSMTTSDRLGRTGPATRGMTATFIPRPPSAHQRHRLFLASTEADAITFEL